MPELFTRKMYKRLMPRKKHWQTTYRSVRWDIIDLDVDDKVMYLYDRLSKRYNIRMDRILDLAIGRLYYEYRSTGHINFNLDEKLLEEMENGSTTR